MHISSDPDLNIHAIEITDYAVTDIEVLEQLMPEEIERLLKLLPMVHIIAGTETLNERRDYPCYSTTKSRGSTWFR